MVGEFDDRPRVIDHVERARPPWQRSRITECGRWVEDMSSVVSVDALGEKVQRLGKTRAGFGGKVTQRRLFPGAMSQGSGGGLWPLLHNAPV